MLLDRRKVKFWQKIVFGFMAFLMAAFLVVGYSGVLNGCTLFNSAQEDATQQAADLITKAQAAVTADPQNADAWAALGDKYVQHANLQPANSDGTPTDKQTADWEQAVKAYKKADKLLSEQKGADVKQQRLSVLERLVGVYLYLQDAQAATSTYGEITSLRPKDAQSYFDMATVAIQAGDTNTALLAFTRFLELDPQSTEAAAVKDWIKQNTPQSSPTPSPSPTK